MIAGKARANAKKYSLSLGEAGGKKSNGMFCVLSHDSILTIQTIAEHICDLEDTRGRYSALLNTYDLRGTKVLSPDVRDEHGVRIHVSDYKNKLKEGMIVELSVILKL